jgi:hypothetical protein
MTVKGEVDGIRTRIPRFLQDPGGGDHGRRPALLVAGSPAVHQAVGDVTREGIEVPLAEVAGLHRIDVGIEGDAFAPVADLEYEAAEAVDPVIAQSVLVENRRDLPDHRLLLS